MTRRGCLETIAMSGIINGGGLAWGYSCPGGAGLYSPLFIQG